jgi:hypothetical protein
MIATGDWATANQQDLTLELARIRSILERAAESGETRREDSPSEPHVSDAAYAVGRLCNTFQLSGFERDVLLLCAGCELDARFRSLLGRLADVRERPTFGLALAILPQAHWSALTPDGPLRRWRLVEMIDGGLTTAELRIDERILHCLTGVDDIDERVRNLVEILQPSPTSDADAEAAAIVAERCTGGQAVQIASADAHRRRRVAAATCAVLGARGLCLHADDIPAATHERVALARLLARESLLARTVTIVVASDADDGRVRRLLEVLRAPAMVLTRDSLSLPADVTTVDLPNRTPADRRSTWRSALGPSATAMNGTVQALASQFDLDDAAIARIAAHTAGLEAEPVDTAAAAMWEAARRAARPRLDGLAQRLESVAGWDDLVIPPAQSRVLHEIAAHVRHRTHVYDDWGFAATSNRGLGITALFAGAPGTGKTMAAEVLARELQLDLYRVDLAGVVSKYIGETEKNLRRLFDAAEGSGAILLFDEADALFGKRSDVKDSHDRYANIEISYLLQRMEAYRGLAILTTNMKQALDAAFARRIRFVVNFPFPDAAQRARIWRGIFPASAPVADLDYARLAQLNVSGGHIRNIAMAAAFLAAERRSSITMQDLQDAARAEYAKLERPLTDGELRGWV